jgi:perosamine synthetase
MSSKKLHDKFLPYGRQWIDDDDIQAVVGVLKSDYLTTGPKIAEFEQAFAEYVGAKYAVAVSNGTAALHAAAFAAGIHEGDEVITSPITFAASANCVLYMGGRPIYADIDSKTYNIDPMEIRKQITSKTKAIIPVHFTGQPVDLDEIHSIADKYRLVVIEDAAHALGAEYKGKRIGGLSNMTIFSFHPVKQITTGEGGMVTTNNPDYYQKLLLFRTHGITRDKTLLLRNEGDWYYEQQELGFNYRITDFQAALGLSQLKKADMFLKRRRELADIYNQSLQNIPGVLLPYQTPNCNSSWHLYVIQIGDEAGRSRREVYDGLKKANIGVNVHYIPVYFHPYYQALGYPKGLCPNAETYYQRALTLPLFPGMGERDALEVVEILKEILEDKF